ncbi:hypothetical protein FB446DRAFT_384833 [Lentinula raphanica]|nr:hypothetical protein FB446DRAFT_384833 [Lentinula raphanica]
MPSFTKSLPVALLVGASALASPIAPQPQPLDGKNLCLPQCTLINGAQLCTVPYTKINLDDPTTYQDFRPSQIPSADFEAYLRTCQSALDGVPVADGKKHCSPDNNVCVMLAQPFGSASSNSSSNSASNSTSNSTSNPASNSSPTGDVQGTVLLTTSSSQNNAQNSTASGSGVAEDGAVGIQDTGLPTLSAPSPNQNGRVQIIQTNGASNAQNTTSSSASGATENGVLGIQGNGPAPLVVPSRIQNDRVEITQANQPSAVTTDSIPSVGPLPIPASQNMIINGFTDAPLLNSGNSGDLDLTENDDLPPLMAVANRLNGLNRAPSASIPSASIPSASIPSASIPSVSTLPVSTLRNEAALLNGLTNGQIPSTGPVVGVVGNAGPSDRNSTRPSSGGVGATETVQPAISAGSATVDASESVDRQTESLNGLEVTDSANPSTLAGSPGRIGVASTASQAAQQGANIAPSNRVQVSQSTNTLNRPQIANSTGNQTSSNSSNGVEISSTTSTTSNANRLAPGSQSVAASVEGNCVCGPSASEGAAVGM